MSIGYRSSQSAREPEALVERYRTQFLTQFSMARDGDPDAIHDARVVTRRLREALRLVDADHHRVDSAIAAARTAGRALGKVRELDVLVSVFRTFELRVPPAAGAAATTCAILRTEQRAARRRMIKVLDDVDLSALNVLQRDRRGGLFTRRTQVAWRNRLFDRIDQLAGEVERATHHASGVYLPNRSHDLRIAVKKLRYAVEAAHEAHLGGSPDALDALRRAQGKLGDIHDLHVALERIGPLSQNAPEDQRTLLEAVIAAELDRRHQQFLRLRQSLTDAVDECRRRARAWQAKRRLMRRAPLLVGLAAVPGAIALIASSVGETQA